MSLIVVDTSITLAWCFEDEATPQTQALLDRLAVDEAIVPSLWHLELANVLSLAERHGRLTPARTAQFTSLLHALPITVDTETATHALGDTLNLCRAHRLTAYDAAYLELAMRRGAALATKDAALRRAAGGLGVELLGV